MSSPIQGQSQLANIEQFRSRSTQVDSSTRPTGKTFNRSVSTEHNTTSAFSKDSSKTNSTALSERSVSTPNITKSLLTPTPSEPKQLHTSAEFFKDAGAPKTGTFKNSPTLKQLAASLDAYHNTTFNSESERFEALESIENKASEFSKKKEGEAANPKNKSLAKTLGRIKGTSLLLKSIQGERNSHIQSAVKEAALNRHANANQLLSKFSPSQIVDALNTLAPDEKENCLAQLTSVYDQLGTSEKGTELVLDVIKQDGGSPESIKQHMPTLMSAMSSGTLEQSADSVYMAHQQGVLNLGAMATIGQGKISYLSMNGMDTQESLHEMLATVDESKQQGSAALSHCKTHPPITSLDDPTGEVIQTLSAQATLLFKDRLLKAGGDDPAFTEMVKAWDQLYMQDAIDYNKTLPSEKQHIDINTKAFNAQIDRLDSNYFSKIASGESIDPASMGWEPIGDNWQQAPDTGLIGREAVVADFFANHAPGIKK